MRDASTAKSTANCEASRWDGEQLKEIAALAQAGVSKPIVSRVFPLNRPDEAYTGLATGRTRGKDRGSGSI
ncbi:zinc-binding dehydrogenase [Pseudomonas sp. NPDC086278]|uniref:zinc-binding dehydrogenase n=1 Tax=Pseudomonas sp. NPDC086278 TaxID=3390646 RepID=UPI003D073386